MSDVHIGNHSIAMLSHALSSCSQLTHLSLSQARLTRKPLQEMLSDALPHLRQFVYIERLPSDGFEGEIVRSLTTTCSHFKHFTLRTHKDCDLEKECPEDHD
jgi:hypothetical protein